jgi:hypothetical protein
MIREFIHRFRNAAAFLALVLMAAAVADGSTVRQVGQIQSKEVAESSGVVASRQFDGVYYTHNDSGNAPSVYAIKADGTVLREYRIPSKHTDWEDIAVDDQNRLYIGNIGNNDAQKTQVEVFRFQEPDPTGQPAVNEKKKRIQKKPKKDKDRDNEVRVGVEKSWRLSYPDKPFNAESLFIHGGHGYVVSKMPVGMRAAVYRFPLDGASEVTLEKVAELPIKAPVTGADLTRDGNRMAVLSEAGLYLFDVGGDVAKAGSVTPRVIPLPNRKLEGVCFGKEGIVITAESREIYLVPDDPLAKK